VDKLRPGQIISLVAGSLVLIMSFTDQAKDGDNLWNDFGLQTFPPILAGVIVAVVAVAAFGSGGLPERIGPLRTVQWMVALAFAGVLIFIGYWQVIEHAKDLVGDSASVKLSATFWLGLLGSIALLVGTFMELQSSPSNRGAAPSAPSPF
jgi:hypothetical protein